MNKLHASLIDLMISALFFAVFVMSGILPFAVLSIIFIVFSAENNIPHTIEGKR